jgi:hypothetical protein
MLVTQATDKAVRRMIIHGQSGQSQKSVISKTKLQTQRLRGLVQVIGYLAYDS